MYKSVSNLLCKTQSTFAFIFAINSQVAEFRVCKKLSFIEEEILFRSLTMPKGILRHAQPIGDENSLAIVGTPCKIGDTCAPPSPL